MTDNSRRYPDPSIRTFDPRFKSLILASASVECLYQGTRWSEGPVWFGDGRYLLWSDIPNDRILRWDEPRRHNAFGACLTTRAAASPDAPGLPLDIAQKPLHDKDSPQKAADSSSRMPSRVFA
jgi:hypothetical protein